MGLNMGQALLGCIISYQCESQRLGESILWGFRWQSRLGFRYNRESVCSWF